MVSSMGFEEAILLKTPNNLTQVELLGLHSKHWLNFDNNGNSVNSKNAHITINESDLIANNYPYRNSQQEINLDRHKVEVSDSSRFVKKYVILEWHPSETFGTIICTLGDYE